MYSILFTLMVLCENEYFLISNLLCFFIRVKLCPLVSYFTFLNFEKKILQLVDRRPFLVLVCICTVLCIQLTADRFLCQVGRSEVVWTRRGRDSVRRRQSYTRFTMTTWLPWPTPTYTRVSSWAWRCRVCWTTSRTHRNTLSHSRTFTEAVNWCWYI